MLLATGCLVLQLGCKCCLSIKATNDTMKPLTWPQLPLHFYNHLYKTQSFSSFALCTRWNTQTHQQSRTH